jgi:hypothetical protein
MEKFLTSAHDYLIILNSDLVLKPGILNKIRETDIDYEKTIMLPNPVNEFSVNPPDTVNEIPGGFPGIMIVLSKEMCKAVYPIPTGLKLWFLNRLIPLSTFMVDLNGEVGWSRRSPSTVSLTLSYQSRA